jgi:hypothetical protein
MKYHGLPADNGTRKKGPFWGFLAVFPCPEACSKTTENLQKPKKGPKKSSK